MAVVGGGAVLTLAVLSELLDGAPTALIVVDERRIVHIFNRAAAQLCGLPAGAVVGRTLEQAMPKHEDLRIERASFEASGWQVLVLSTREPRRAASAPRAWRGRVLVAEDNLVSQRVAVAMLERLGLRCVVAGDGAEALAIAAETPFDAILMDCHMPKLDGLEVTKRLRAWPEPRRSVAVIAMLSGSATEERAACFEAGADACVRKPVALAEVKEVLARWLSVSEPPCVDEEVLGDLVVEMGVAEVEALVDQFLAQLERVTEGLGEAAARADLEAASRAAHGLVGSAGTLGAARLVTVCRDLERVCRWPAPRYLQEATDEVLAEARSLGPALAGWVRGRGGTG